VVPHAAVVALDHLIIISFLVATVAVHNHLGLGVDVKLRCEIIVFILKNLQRPFRIIYSFFLQAVLLSEDAVGMRKLVSILLALALEKEAMMRLA